MSALEKITERVNRNGDLEVEGTPIPLLSIEEFFEGNDVVGSIGCNLDSEPAPSQFYDLFKTVEALPDVDKIYIQITMFDDPDWPFSDTVWIVTSKSEDEVRAWFSEEIAPEEVREGWIESQSYEPVPVPQGYRVIACWWDQLRQ